MWLRRILSAVTDILLWHRCALTRGSWCTGFHQQAPVPWAASPRGSQDCPQACNGVGRCDFDTGTCRCSAGWTGPACAERQDRQCQQPPQSWQEWTSFERLPGLCGGAQLSVEHQRVMSHVNACRTHYWTRSQKPILYDDVKCSTSLLLRHPSPRCLPEHVLHELASALASASSLICNTCAAECDVNIGFCFCNGTFGRDFDLHGMPFTAKSGQSGRPVSWHFQPGMSLRRRDGRLHRLFRGVRPGTLWDERKGWCMSKHPAQTPPCHLENLGGAHCDVAVESTCVNQCGGHGTCHLGFCQCDPGWCVGPMLALYHPHASLHT